MLCRYQERDSVTQQLYSRLKSRADVATLEQRNVVPRGYFADAVCPISTPFLSLSLSLLKCVHVLHAAMLEALSQFKMFQFAFFEKG